MKDNWRKIKLDALGRHYGGLTNKSKDNFGKGKPYIPYLNIYLNGRIDVDNLELVEIFPSESQNKVQKGDLFFTTSSETPHEVGMTSVLLDDIGEAYLNSFCFGFRLDNFEKLLPEFAVHLFRGKEVRKTISDLAQGSTRYNLSKSIFFNKLYLNLPPLPQQQQIAKILSTVDNVIEKTESAIAKYQAIKQGLMHDLFTRGIDVDTGKLRSTPKEAPELYKESVLGLIPRDWGIEVLDNCINPSTVITYGIVQTGEHVEGGIRVLRTVNLNKDGIESSNLLRTTKAISDGYKRTYLKENDIVCNVRASVGDFNIIDKSLTDCNLTRGVARISLNDSINPIYMLAFLRSKLNADQMSLLIKGTTFIDINIADLRTIKALLPIHKEEQSLIANTITSIEGKIKTEQQALVKYQQLKAGLLQDLLTGKVEVKVEKKIIE
ncbi:restriction endonuclease subunit S [Bacteroidota bacterium]